MKKWLKQFIATQCGTHDLEVVSCRQRTHPVMMLLHKRSGKQFRVVLPATPSDWRAVKNKEAEIRNAVKELN